MDEEEEEEKRGEGRGESTGAVCHKAMGFLGEKIKK